MLASSLFSWSFLAASLLGCTVMLNQYETQPRLTIREVFGTSLLISLTFATGMTLIARRHAFSRILERMTGPAELSKAVATHFGNLSGKMGVQKVSLREAIIGSAFSLSFNKRSVVAVSPHFADSLSSEETEAVLAHELSHIKNGDSFAKGLARLARGAFPFDPVLRLVEAAVHRERELWADKVAVQFTKKPRALASALIKANSRPLTATTTHTAGLFVGGNGRGLLSPHPNLERRVNTLLELARQMEIVPSSAIIA